MASGDAGFAHAAWGLHSASHDQETSSNLTTSSVRSRMRLLLVLAPSIEELY